MDEEEIRYRRQGGVRVQLPSMVREIGKPETTQVVLSTVETQTEVSLEIDVSPAALERKEVRQFITELVEQAIILLAESVAKGFNESKQWIREGNLSFEKHAEFFPFFAWPDRRVELHIAENIGSVVSGAVDLNRSLVGQSIENAKVAFGTIKVLSKVVLHLDPSRAPLESDRPAFEVQILSFEIDAIRFEEGTLRAWVRILEKPVTLAVAILGLALAATQVEPLHAAIADWNHIRQIRADIKEVLQDAPAVKYSSFKFDEDDLRHKGAEAFNFKAHNITPDESKFRICNVQLVLRIALRTDLQVDGHWGPKSQAHLKEFLRHTDPHLPPDVANDFVQARLLQVLWPIHPQLTHDR